jgi:hypothetical protein
MAKTITPNKILQWRYNAFIFFIEHSPGFTLNWAVRVVEVAGILVVRSTGVKLKADYANGSPSGSKVRSAWFCNQIVSEIEDCM